MPEAMLVGERRQMKIGRLRILGRDRRRRAQKPALQVVGPAMEAAAEGLAVARRRAHDLHVLMPAGIAQDPHGPSLSRTPKTPQPPTVAETKSPGLAIWPSAQSGSHSRRENRAFLGLEGVALGVILGFHGICIRIGTFARPWAAN